MRRLLPAILAAAAIVPAAAPATAHACAHASAAPAAPAQAGAAVLCLVNQERARRGLAPLRADSTLSVLAFSHSRDMVARRYFNHTSPDGRSYEARVKAARWVSPKRRWMVGENISWGSGQMGTPASVVARWMTSPGHRANILHPAFRHAGVGVAPGVPSPQPMPGATYTMDFGLH